MLGHIDVYIGAFLAAECAVMPRLDTKHFHTRLHGLILVTHCAVKTQYRQLFVYLAVHRKMGGLANDFDTLSAVMGFNPK